MTLGTTRVVGCQPHAPAAFTPRGIPGTHFLGAELTPGHMVLSVSTRKFPVTARLVAQCLNHCAISGPPAIYTGTEKKHFGYVDDLFQVLKGMAVPYGLSCDTGAVRRRGLLFVNTGKRTVKRIIHICMRPRHLNMKSRHYRCTNATVLF